MTTLFFHIGGGKTGSTSIQATLKANMRVLRDSNIEYWGLMLEYSPVQLYHWQYQGGTEAFYNSKDGVDELYSVLSQSLDISRKNGIKVAIWSNEWFLGAQYEFSRNAGVIEAIDRLYKNGYSVKVIAYIREHISWSISAYTQWGIKHKTYHGEIMSFNSYTNARPPRFLQPLLAWKKCAEYNLKLYNYSASGDVTKHFLGQVCALPVPELTLSRDNERPSHIEMFLRAAFNREFPDSSDVTPDEFNRLIGRHKDIDSVDDIINWYNELLPTPEDVKDLELRISEDKQGVNMLLAECGEQIFSEGRSKVAEKIDDKDASRIIALLISIIASLNTRCTHLERETRCTKQA